MEKEIGGYFELDRYGGAEYHENAISLNAGRNAIAYLVKARRYKKVFVPAFCCDSILDGITKGGAEVSLYAVDETFSPQHIGKMDTHEALLVINYYGQLTENEILDYKACYGNIILDNTQAFFQKRIKDVDAVYSCRKFFGVPDGAYLYTDATLHDDLMQDVSHERMQFVLGRFETDACSYYSMAANNNEFFSNEPIKYMSALTHNLLRAIDYEGVAEKRKQNAQVLHEAFQAHNCYAWRATSGTYMYPLLLPKTMHGDSIRKQLQQRRIYVPCLWPDALRREKEDAVAAYLARNIVPLPCDQRYDTEDMKHIISVLSRIMCEEDSQ